MCANSHAMQNKSCIATISLSLSCPWKGRFRVWIFARFFQPLIVPRIKTKIVLQKQTHFLTLQAKPPLEKARNHQEKLIEKVSNWFQKDFFGRKSFTWDHNKKRLAWSTSGHLEFCSFGRGNWCLCTMVTIARLGIGSSVSTSNDIPWKTGAKATFSH